MTIAEKTNKCIIFFDKLCELLQDNYERISSCNNDISAYLVPNGTREEVTYFSKPAKSFRISDHWNWYANLNKCSNPHYIQCYSIDIPHAKKRLDVGKASKPVFGVQVSFFGSDKKYHCVYGEKFDKKSKKWLWVETNPEDIIKNYI